MDEGASGGPLGLAEERVGLDDVLASAIAPIDLDVVGAPIGEGPHVLELMVLRPGHGGAASLCPGIGVKGVLEPMVDMSPRPEARG
jgi:hypothetical protein